MTERPRYIIQVHRNWKYGPRARFWSIKEWVEADWHSQGGFWTSACRGGLAYTEWGMWRSINKRLKKLKFGYHDTYFTIDGKKLDGTPN